MIQKLGLIFDYVLASDKSVFDKSKSTYTLIMDDDMEVQIDLTNGKLILIMCKEILFTVDYHDFDSSQDEYIVVDMFYDSLTTSMDGAQDIPDELTSLINDITTDGYKDWINICMRRYKTINDLRCDLLTSSVTNSLILIIDDKDRFIIRNKFGDLFGLYGKQITESIKNVVGGK